MLGQPIRDHDVAVISMTGRFPGASSVEGLWKNLEHGVESFAEITTEDIERAGSYGILASHPNYVRRRPVLDDIRGFDATLFGFSPREAMITDPQIRIFLECVYEALDLAGYGRTGERGRVGIFAGNNVSMYLQEQFLNRPEILLRVDPHELIVGNDKDSLTTVAAYRLDLTGPAVSVQTFCSTSAVAIHMACQSLRQGECDMALAGGVCVRVPNRVGYIYTEGGMESPDGRVRTFDAKGRGGVFGDGSAAVVLKLLHRAVTDRDAVLAVIRGSAINNDGASKFSYTAPSVVGQAAAVAAALADAEVAPRDVSYVEAHGTATELGDPIEVAALTRAFRAAELTHGGKELRDRQYCAIGSVKTNVGHLDRAATVTGFIKVIEAMRHELIPRSLHYETPNPDIDFARSPFFVAGTAIPWPRQAGRPRLAGVNGLGMGGTNVHIVVQEAPDPPPRPPLDRVLAGAARFRAVRAGRRRLLRADGRSSQQRRGAATAPRRYRVHPAGRARLVPASPGRRSGLCQGGRSRVRGQPGGPRQPAGAPRSDKGTPQRVPVRRGRRALQRHGRRSLPDRARVPPPSCGRPGTAVRVLKNRCHHAADQ